VHRPSKRGISAGFRALALKTASSAHHQAFVTSLTVAAGFFPLYRKTAFWRLSAIFVLGIFIVTLVPDFGSTQMEAVRQDIDAPRHAPGYLLGKRALDLGFSTLVLLPAMAIVGLFLVLLNPVFNPGPLLFTQNRMGRDCKPFRAIKFRTMAGERVAGRGPNDPVETDRITPLGRMLRITRFDELPQIINVYRGDMSLIGPRPDDFDHATYYLRHIPEYRHRHMVRPGISGLAQTELGYAEGLEATRLKTATDIDYIRRASLRLDLWIFWRTMVTVWTMRGT
jgi:lipopolysaccharide/colanic/teichoic acid biosynthesis glycosyltransferase